MKPLIRFNLIFLPLLALVLGLSRHVNEIVKIRRAQAEHREQQSVIDPEIRRGS